MYEILWYFVIYALLGWCCEVCWCSVGTGQWVNRGFLNGPVCPIYGFGMLFIVLALQPLRDDLPLLFLGAMALCSLLELATGFVLKKLFHTSWWDYSENKFNIGGYICLQYSLMWGVAGTLALRLLHPAVARVVGVMPRSVGWAVLTPILAVFVCDAVATVNTIAKLNRDLGEMTRVAGLLHRQADLLAESLGTDALAASEKIQREQEKMAERRDELEGSAEAVRAGLRARLDMLRADMADRRLFGAARLLRAFPKMRSSRYAEALEQAKEWVREYKK